MGTEGRLVELEDPREILAGISLKQSLGNLDDLFQEGSAPCFPLWRLGQTWVVWQQSSGGRVWTAASTPSRQAALLRGAAVARGLLLAPQPQQQYQELQFQQWQGQEVQGQQPVLPQHQIDYYYYHQHQQMQHQQQQFQAPALHPVASGQEYGKGLMMMPPPAAVYQQQQQQQQSAMHYMYAPPHHVLHPSAPGWEGYGTQHCGQMHWYQQQQQQHHFAAGQIPDFACMAATAAAAAAAAEVHPAALAPPISPTGHRLGSSYHPDAMALPPSLSPALQEPQDASKSMPAPPPPEQQQQQKQQQPLIPQTAASAR